MMKLGKFELLARQARNLLNHTCTVFIKYRIQNILQRWQYFVVTSTK